MQIQHLRNATIIVTLGSHRILVDPMLAPRGTLPPLRILGGPGLGGRQRNPLVDLPACADAALDGVTHALITHCQKGHFDHLDRAAKRWLRDRKIPVICSPEDAAHLRARGLDARPLPADHAQPSPFLGGRIRTVRCTHGRGLVGRFMAHGVGYLIELPGEPSLYLSGDTVLTPAVETFVTHHRPEVCVVPAGGAKFDVGGEIIMGIDDVVALCCIAPGIVIANHLEALGHCPETRAGLAEAARRAGIGDRLRIPEDGELLTFRGAGN